MEVLKKIIEFVMDILETITFVGSIFIVIYLFLFQPHQIQGASMDKSFEDGQYIITSKIAYRIAKPERGDVVVFKAPNAPEYDYIKRIVGLPGDKIKIAGGSVYINDKQQDENYAQKPTNVFENGFVNKEGQTIIIPQGRYFVMGDNRLRSSDSREFGFVPLNSIVGKVIFRYFPVDKMGLINNPLKQKKLSLNSFYPTYLSYSSY